MCTHKETYILVYRLFHFLLNTLLLGVQKEPSSNLDRIRSLDIHLTNKHKTQHLIKLLEGGSWNGW